MSVRTFTFSFSFSLIFLYFAEISHIALLIAPSILSDVVVERLLNSSLYTFHDPQIVEVLRQHLSTARLHVLDEQVLVAQHLSRLQQLLDQLPVD